MYTYIYSYIYSRSKSKRQKSSINSKNIYILHSVLVHEGGVGGGHYYAYIRPNNRYV